jgi:hypothetical protein
MVRDHPSGAPTPSLSMLGFQRGWARRGGEDDQRRRCWSNWAGAVASYRFGESGRWPAGQAGLTHTSHMRSGKMGRSALGRPRSGLPPFFSYLSLSILRTLLICCLE